MPSVLVELVMTGGLVDWESAGAVDARSSPHAEKTAAMDPKSRAGRAAALAKGIMLRRGSLTRGNGVNLLGL